MATALIQSKRDLANLIEDYQRREATILRLEKDLEVIRQQSSDSLALVKSMQQTIDELKDRNDLMKSLILSSEATDKRQVEEFKKELSNEKKRGNKKLLFGAAGGFIIGVLIMAVAK